MNFPLNLLTLPIWWYTQGLTLIWDFNQKQLTYLIRKSGLVFFSRNLLKPLYQDYSKSGVIVSFFLRICVVGYKAVYLLVAVFFLFVFDLIYLAWLPAVVCLIAWQILSK